VFKPSRQWTIYWTKYIYSIYLDTSLLSMPKYSAWLLSFTSPKQTSASLPGVSNQLPAWLRYMSRDTFVIFTYAIQITVIQVVGLWIPLIEVYDWLVCCTVLSQKSLETLVLCICPLPVWRFLGNQMLIFMPFFLSVPLLPSWILVH